MALTISNLVKDYVAPDATRQRVLDIPAFHLDLGQSMALIGSSGSGKTTLLHAIAGIIVPDSGTIEFTAGGSTTLINHLSEARRDQFRGKHIGYVFQTHHLLGGFTALENVLLGMSFTGRGSDAKWAKHLLDTMGLGERLHYRPSQLSIGQQQRVAVARALANRPSLVLADEPTGALDSKNAQIVLDLMQRLCSEVKAMLLVVTHDRQLAGQLPGVTDLLALNRAATGAEVAA